MQQHQQFCELNLPTQPNIVEERRQYDPTPLQYQESAATNTTTQPTTIDDFEENLLNSLMYSVDESTEREILKNLNIRDDELLTACNLTSENSSLDGQPFTVTDDQLFDEQLLAQIQENEDYGYQSEAQHLLQGTRNDLEKELTMFREINLHETQENSSEEKETNNDIMLLNQKSPKYINHAKLDDHLLYKWEFFRWFMKKTLMKFWRVFQRNWRTIWAGGNVQ